MKKIYKMKILLPKLFQKNKDGELRHSQKKWSNELWQEKKNRDKENKNK